MVRDREFLSTEHLYKVMYGVSKKVKIFDPWDSEGSRSIAKTLDVEYLDSGAR